MYNDHEKDSKCLLYSAKYSEYSQKKYSEEIASFSPQRGKKQKLE